MTWCDQIVEPNAFTKVSLEMLLPIGGGFGYLDIFTCSTISMLEPHCEPMHGLILVPL